MLFEKHEGLFECMIARIGRENVLENLCIIYRELEPSNFGTIMACLTLVFKVSDFCDKETVCDAVRICVWDLKQVDIASFEIKQSWTQRLIAWLHNLMCKSNRTLTSPPPRAYLGNLLV